MNIDSSMPAAELLKPLAHKILTEGFTSPEVIYHSLDLIFIMTQLLFLTLLFSFLIPASHWPVAIFVHLCKGLEAIPVA